MSVQQLKTYIYALPWYKRIFFPQTIWDCLQQESITEAEIRAIYASKIYGSWLEPFYGWLFPDLVLFVRMPFEQISLQMEVIPLEENIIQLPVNYESTLRESIVNKDNSEFNRLVSFLSTHIIEEDALIRILRTSMIHKYYDGTCILLEQSAFTTEVVSKAFVEAVKITNKEWLGINIFQTSSMGNEWPLIEETVIQEFDGLIPLRAKISSASINEVLLIRAKDYQEAACYKDSDMMRHFHYRVCHDLEKLLSNSRMRGKITLETITQLLHYLIVPLEYEHEDSSHLVHDALNFKDSEGNQLNSIVHQTAYLNTIKAGRVKTFDKFQEDLIPPHDERVIQALTDAAKNAHYAMVLHLIKKIPSARRFVILQTKSIVRNDKQYKDTNEPEFTHILQWAACRPITEDIHAILDTLDNTEERYALITSTPSRDDYSPLLLASVNCRQENLSIMLDALSYEQAIEAILPHKVTFFTPLDQFHSHPQLSNHEIKIMPTLLGKVFGENEKLYAAYQYLKGNLSWDTLRALRDHYLATYFPTNSQTTLRLFTRSYSIPGHSLNKEELDKVVRVVFYQNYHKFDSAQRERIEFRMNSREQLSENVAVI